MDLFSIANKLDLNVWEKKDSPAAQADIEEKGYKEYQVTISKVEGDARMYYLSTDRGDLTAAKLLGSSGKTDPLQGVNKCFFLIEDAAEEAEKKSPGLIRGIAFEDDWVEYKR